MLGIDKHGPFLTHVRTGVQILTRLIKTCVIWIKIITEGQNQLKSSEELTIYYHCYCGVSSYSVNSLFETLVLIILVPEMTRFFVNNRACLTRGVQTTTYTHFWATTFYVKYNFDGIYGMTMMCSIPKCIINYNKFALVSINDDYNTPCCRLRHRPSSDPQ